MKTLKERLVRWSPYATMFYVVSLVVVVLDQWSKYWAVANLTAAFSMDGGAATFGERLSRFLWTEHPARVRAITVLEDFWHFRYAENPGSAWSFLATAPDYFRTPFFLLVSVAAMVFIIVYFRKLTPDQRMLRWALALVFGGALGNFIDRVRLRYVIDFIDWHWYDKATWPTFNIADAAISTAVGLMILDAILTKKAPKAATTSSAAEN